MKHVFIVMTVLLLMLVAGISHSSDPGDREIASSSVAEEAVVPAHEPATAMTDDEPKLAAVQSGEYEKHETWCEDIDKMGCEPDGDPCKPDRTGRAQNCVRPYWAKRAGVQVHVCAPAWLNRRERKERHESLGVIVESVCREPAWAAELSEWGKENRMGSDPSKLCWRLKGGTQALKDCKGKHFCQSKKLDSLLSLVASRESSWQNQTTHELNLDKEANRSSYVKARKRQSYPENPHFGDSSRWQRGYGWYGMNASIHVRYWDRKAPPEILCRQVESTEIYLRKARGSFRKLWKMYGDQERVFMLDTGKEITVRGVTWYDVHRAASSGKLSVPDVVATKSGFAMRAKSRGLDPFEAVMYEMLGEGIPKEHQADVADEIRRKIDRRIGRSSSRASSGQPSAVATF